MRELNPYDAALNAGIQITSTSTSALNGTYGLDPSAISAIQGEQISILTNKAFTNGATTFTWFDIAGAQHVFPSTALFTLFATAVGSYFTALVGANFTQAATGVWTAPAQPGAID